MSIGGVSWFTSLEFPESTALLVQSDKANKYITQMEKQPSGNYIVKYRGLTDEEKKVRKEQERALRPKGGTQGEQARSQAGQRSFKNARDRKEPSGSRGAVSNGKRQR